MWQGIRGHDDVVQQFRRALERNRLASTFLFVGPTGIGKLQFALKLSQALLCERHSEEQLDPCGKCSSCLQVAARTHPDIDLIGRPADKAFVPVELLIGDKDHRMRAGLCYNISLKPYSGRRKFAILDDADFLNKEGANCLLKTLEEPPPRSILILIGSSEQRQLPTIRSRSQVIRFQPLPEQDIAELLIEQGHCQNAEIARRAALLSGGSLERALLWIDPRSAEFRTAFLEQISQREFDLLGLAKQVSQFYEEAGKDAAAKRNRMKDIISIAEQFYRELLVTIATGVGSDDSLSESVARALRWWSTGDEAVASCIDVCIETVAQVDANANLATVSERWLDELSTVARTGRAGAA
jgi:DNA polymerase-3 subunit delta'